MVNNKIKISTNKKIKLPNILFLVAGNNHIVYQDLKLHRTTLNIRSLGAISRSTLIIVCNKKSILNFSSEAQERNLIDVLDLFILLYPTALCSPSIHSIYKFLLEINKIKTENEHKIITKLLHTKNLEERQFLELDCLIRIYEILLDKIIDLTNQDSDFLDLISYVSVDNWNWSKILSYYLTFIDKPKNKKINIWEAIEDREDEEDQSLFKNPDITTKNISNEKVIEKLKCITKSLGNPRDEQTIYCLEVIKKLNIENLTDSINSNTNDNHITNILLAEAGTGVGKTLAYCSSILAFIEENPMQQVVISTYSKVLQKQVYNVLKNSFNQENTFKEKVTLVKGVNNYICLLNYEYLLANPNVLGESRLFIAVISRWVIENKEGDIIGGNISSLIYMMFPNKFFNYLLNKREECIYSRCKHFKKCFIMRNKIDIKKANIIISNHSLTLLSDGFNVKNIVFDEAHNLFNTADDVYSYEISIKEFLNIRYFIHGTSNSRKSNSSLNGIKQRLHILLNRVENTITEDSIHIHEEIDLEIKDYLNLFLNETENLPDFKSLDNILRHSPSNIFEDFFHKLYLHILENTSDINKKYTQEILISNHILNDQLKQSIETLKLSLQKIINISSYLLNAIDKKIVHLSEDEEKSFLFFKGSFETICVSKFTNFLSMLYEIEEPEDLYIYRFLCIKDKAIEVDIAYSKNYINPMLPLNINMFARLNSLVLTSATLAANKLVVENKNEYLNKKFGLNFLDNANISYLHLKSPFDYKNNSKIIITKAPKETINFSGVLSKILDASNGGALCLFTSIERLKNVYDCTNNLMKESHINIYAQHSKNQSIVNLLDMFKDDINSCMLGTDAARDGIDIPGNSLRMVLFEKTPWPKRDILLKIRTQKLGMIFHDDIVVQNLKQAFGRLIRTKNDNGIFIILDTSVPSKFLANFSEDIEINKLEWHETISFVNKFFN